MKLLLDENISHRLLRAIIEEFPGSVHVNFAEVPLRSDHVIWNYAKEHHFTILTFDSDFVQIAALRGTPPRVILLQLRNPSYPEIARLLLAKRTSIAEFISDNSKDASGVMGLSA